MWILPNAETVSKNTKNTIPQESQRLAPKTCGIEFFVVFATVSAFGTIRIGFIEFC
jgi:hypothetical protein